MDLYKIFTGLFQILKLDFEKFVTIYNSILPDYIWIVFLLFCFIAVLIFLKLFGEVGLYIYSVIAIIVANIQVLKLVKFSFAVVESKGLNPKVKSINKVINKKPTKPIIIFNLAFFDP